MEIGKDGRIELIESLLCQTDDVSFICISYCLHIIKQSYNNNDTESRHKLC